MDGDMEENYFEEIDYEEERLYRQRRLQRIEEMRRQKRRVVLVHRIAFLAVSVAMGVLSGFGILGLRNLASQADRAAKEQVRDLSGEKDGSIVQGEDSDRNGSAGGGSDFSQTGASIGTGTGNQGQGGAGVEPGSEGQNLGDNGAGGGDDAQEIYSGSQPDQVPAGAFGAGNGTTGSADPGYSGMGPFLPEQYSQVFWAERTSITAGLPENVVSPYGILIDVSEESVLACRDGYSRMNPASMTKILTILVAAEALGIRTGNEAVLEDTVEITIEITDYCFINKCSVIGFEVGEKVTVRDLFYGTILPSGADAALGLAGYVAGSQEAFVERMNQKLEDLGMGETTHFTNCVGLYDENHYSTAYDIAVILKMTADNPFCRMALSAHTYNTSLTEQHPEGLLASNWFLRRIEDRDTHGEVLCGKTGYVDQSGSCAASLAVDGDGKEYLCVTAGAGSSMLCIADHVELYQKYLKGNGGGQ